ncbi:hypothetical protein LQV63_04140 [Paenibacillus profundus]|uniref:Uncharacterized protein n=1 Tax=Paenibacillus profundus TaxID=1173085 RepID=A0ABS8YDI7_9BACL|nr:hypothetical protein [Paenibacillus profundus]MCE5168503.1 hypothetical protein [Paenibacillus profundus]
MPTTTKAYIDLENLVPTITEGGKPVPFNSFMTGCSDEFLFDNDIKNLLHAAERDDVFWGDVKDYVSPIVGRVLEYAAEEKPAMYRDMMCMIVSEYERFKEMYDSERNEEIVEVKADGSNLKLALEELDSHLKAGYQVEKITYPGGAWYTIELKRKEAPAEVSV